MKHLTKETLSGLYDRISPFEFKEKLIELATYYKKDTTKLLDAGRGNPNWTATEPRQAFFTLGQFAVTETTNHWERGKLAGMPVEQGMYERFEIFCENNANLPAITLLHEMITAGAKWAGVAPTTWLYTLVDAIIGDNYPYPDRMITPIEKVVGNYLTKELCPELESSQFEVFATEGGSAGMCYLFDSLLQNHLLTKGDKIALMTPIFTPYLEIPALPQYNFEIVRIEAQQACLEQQYTQEVIDQLKDKTIKALFVVNPSNPGSLALDEKSMEMLVNLVQTERPDLMIITDDVYSTFVESFTSLLQYLPYNTLCVYSLSKYFGVTGWRLGTLMLSKENIFDEHIAKLPEALREHANSRYHHMTATPEKLGFIDRIVADSRQVALNHTAGLSTPQQVQMALFCIYELIDTNNTYKKEAIKLCQIRKQALFKGLEQPYEKTIFDATYYTEINILLWAEAYDDAFVHYLETHYSLFDILYMLAKEHGVVVLRGDAFASSKWGMRISLANLFEEDYYKIGIAMRTIFEQLLQEWRMTQA